MFLAQAGAEEGQRGRQPSDEIKMHEKLFQEGFFFLVELPKCEAT